MDTENVQVPAVKVVVKYKNRKLYDTDTSSYTSIGALLKMPLGSFMVISHDTKEDITEEILISGLNVFLTENKGKLDEVKTELFQKLNIFA